MSLLVRRLAVPRKDGLVVYLSGLGLVEDGATVGVAHGLAGLLGREVGAFGRWVGVLVGDLGAGSFGHHAAPC